MSLSRYMSGCVCPSEVNRVSAICTGAGAECVILWPLPISSCPNQWNLICAGRDVKDCRQKWKENVSVRAHHRSILGSLLML